MQAKIRKDRQEQVYAQQELRRKIINVIGLIFASILLIAAVVALIYIVVTGLQKNGTL